MKFRFATITILLLLNIIVPITFVVHHEPVAAQTPPPASGSWVISDTTTINDQTILLDGNLIIETSGVLNLKDCTLIMNCSSLKSYSIYMEGSPFSGGEFNVEDTMIRSVDSDHSYNFSVNGSATMNMKRCTVKDLGGQLNLSDPLASLGGIQIHSSNVLIEETTITDYQTIGITVMPLAAPTIKNSNISMDLSDLSMTVGILDSSAGISSPKYQNNYISGNLICGLASVGIPVMSTFSTISGNTFRNNTVGVACYGTSPDIDDNDFELNALSSIAMMDCDSEIWNNRISLSGSGISVLNPCTPDIHDNFINLSGTGVLLNNGTDAKLHHNNISDNLIYGISAIEADPAIYYNDMYNNLMGSIYLDDSSAIIHHNLINGWLSGAGMIIRNDSSPNIYLNHIYGKDYSIGIKLDGNILMTPILDRNKVHVGNNGTCVDLIGYAPSIIDNEFYYGTGANGINISDSSAELKRNKFIATQGAFGAHVKSSTASLENNSFDGNNLGIYAYDSAPIIKYNDFSANDHFGILLDECADIALEKNTFEGVNANPTGKHMNIEMEVINSSSVLADLEPSYLRLLNTSYSAPTLAADSIIHVDWFLNLYVNKPDHTPVQGALVDLLNASGQLMHSFTTDTDGKSLFNQVTEKNFTTAGIEEHSPYNIKAHLDKLADNETVVLNRSKTVTFSIDYNMGPAEPYNILPESTHNRTPLIKWDPSVDPEEDAIYYHLSLGTTQGADDILTDHNTSYLFYQVESNLEFREYYITLSANTPDGNSSKNVQAVMDIFNDPPVLQPIGDRVIHLDVEPHLSIYLDASDPNTDPVDTLQFSVNTTRFSVDPNSGEVNWTSDEEDIGTHFVNFTVSDGYTTDSELVNITVGYLNKAPVANAGENITTYVGRVAQLNASGSYDTDGTIVEYRWTSDWLALFNIMDPVMPQFEPEETGTFSFELMVKDNNGTWSKPDTVWINVLSKELEPKVPELILDDASVTPGTGQIKNNFVFSVTVIGVNVTSELFKMLNDTTLIRLEIDGNSTMVVERVGDVSPLALTMGIQYSVEVSGSELGVGDHKFRFLCSFVNVSGDLGEYDGPHVDKNKIGESQEDISTGDGSTAIIIAVIIIVVIIILIIILMLLKKRSRQPKVSAAERSESKLIPKPRTEHEPLEVVAIGTRLSEREAFTGSKKPRPKQLDPKVEQNQDTFDWEDKDDREGRGKDQLS